MATAAPMPVAEPVTIAALPLRSPCSMCLFPILLRCVMMARAVNRTAPKRRRKEQLFQANRNWPPMRIVLIRHGRPAIPTNPRTSHKGFRAYIDEYECAGLDPRSAPPEELQDLVRELSAIYASTKLRATESAKALE